mmetsp:Transcript_29381/g.57498  ORF Transcript_29381/g.57498 Transcript_29381/m.57498 type:complete len:212 (-) Transcript_29381:280-915(-)
MLLAHPSSTLGTATALGDPPEAQSALGLPHMHRECNGSAPEPCVGSSATHRACGSFRPIQHHPESLLVRKHPRYQHACQQGNSRSLVRWRLSPFAMHLLVALGAELPRHCAVSLVPVSESLTGQPQPAEPAVVVSAPHDYSIAVSRRPRVAARDPPAAGAHHSRTPRVVGQLPASRHWCSATAFAHSQPVLWIASCLPTAVSAFQAAQWSL